MGYTTTFEGEFRLDRPLSAEQRAYLNAFSATRRMRRDPDRARPAQRTCSASWNSGSKALSPRKRPAARCWPVCTDASEPSRGIYLTHNPTSAILRHTG